MNKKILIKKLEIENFLSFQNKQELILNTSGIHLIKGENRDMQNDTFADEIMQTNSAGKSSIGKAIDFAFFGENPNKKIKIDSLINKKTKKNLQVCVEFEINSVLYRIERYRKYTGKGSGLSLLKVDTNEDLSFSDVKLTQERINDLLSLNHDTFLYSILITKESGLNFIELPWYQRSLLLENIVRLDKLREYTKRVKEKMSKDRKDFDFYEKEYYAKKTTISSFYKNLDKKIKSKHEQRKNKNIKIKDLNLKLESFLKGTNIENLESYILFVKNHITIKNGNSLLSKLKVNLKDDLHKLNNIKNEMKILYKKNQCKTEKCKHCDKMIDSEGDSNVQYSIKLSKSRIEEIKKNIKNVIIQIRDVSKEIKLKEEESNKLKNFNIDKEIKKIIMDDIFGGGDGKSYFKNIDPIKEEIKKLETIKIDTSDVKEIIYSIKELKKEAQECQSKITTLEKSLKIGEFWDSSLDFRNEGSLKSYIMSKIVPIFNSYLGSLIDIIFEGNMTINFDNSWNETIIYNGDEYDYNQLSLGEKAKINFCISLSLFSLMRINVGGTNIIFLDEIFSSIDESGIKKFTDILRNSYSEDVAIYIISHEKGILNVKFDSVLNVIKENEKSIIKINPVL